MKTAFKIAWRFLTSSKGQSLLIIVGIAVGVSVQIFIGSLISGLQAQLVDSAVGRSPQITLSSAKRGDTIDDYQTLVDTVQRADLGALHVSPVVDASGFLREGDEDYPIQLRGLDLARADGLYRLSEALVEGTLPQGEQVLLGTTLARQAGIDTYDTITLATPRGATRRATVSGLYDLKTAALNSRWVISDLQLAQDIFGYGDTASSIEMQLEDPFAADAISVDIAALVPGTIKVDNWKALNEQLLSGLSGQSISSLMIQVFVLISVVLAIASVLAISMLQKSKQLGILKAMGIKDGTASLIFLAEGLLLGIAGAVLGAAFGLGLGWAFGRFARSADGTPVVALLIDPQFIGISALIAVVSATLASLIPARRSARLDPMEVIKNG